MSNIGLSTLKSFRIQIPRVKSASDRKKTCLAIVLSCKHFQSRLAIWQKHGVADIFDGGISANDDDDNGKENLKTVCL